jgi:aminomuconate-semialdehyde/2-hydroxymuconate-6-semialdehyde dehydrogenase
MGNALPFFGNIIDGVEVEAVDGARMQSVDPYTREPWAEVALGGKADAVACAAPAGRSVALSHVFLYLLSEIRFILMRFASLLWSTSILLFRIVSLLKQKMPAC